MTQSSRPQADNIANYPAPSDPGPYSADQWAQYMQIVYTTDQQTTQGPIVRYLNELEVADNGTTTVTIATGAGWVNGHLLVSSEIETFAIPAGPVATRIDRVVMVENNSNAEITQTVAGRPLLFPNDLSEYTATPGVPAYSARLAIVRGADGGALPGIDQTTALYMVELYRYTINNVPTISSATDYRVFCHFGGTIGTRTAFTPCINTLNPGPTINHWGEGASVIGVQLDDGGVGEAYGAWQVPTDFRANLVCETAVEGDGTGNLRARCIMSYQACGEAVGTHSVTPAYAQEAIVSGDMECVFSEDLALASIGDVITMRFQRDGGNVLDTVGAEVRCIGWIFTYDALN